MFGSIVVVGVLTRYAVLHSAWDLKAVRMNVHHSLIQELMFYEFGLNHNAMEATKNTFYAKNEGALGSQEAQRSGKVKSA